MTGTQIEWISKEEAAARLELSARRILELAKQGKIRSNRIISTATGQPVVVIHAGSVERYRDKLGDPLIGGDAACEPHAKGIATTRLTERAIGEMLDAVSHAIRTRYGLWLTLDQAADYSGLPAQILRDMVVAGKLEAMDVGRRRGGKWRIRRLSLERIESPPPVCGLLEQRQ